MFWFLRITASFALYLCAGRTYKPMRRFQRFYEMTHLSWDQDETCTIQWREPYYYKKTRRSLENVLSLRKFNGGVVSRVLLQWHYLYCIIPSAPTCIFIQCWPWLRSLHAATCNSSMLCVDRLLLLSLLLWCLCWNFVLE